MTSAEEARLRLFARDSENLKILFAEIDRLREENAELRERKHVPCDSGSREHCQWPEDLT